MRIRCPEGWTTTRVVKERHCEITVHHTHVNVLAGVCDSADLCGISSCAYYDVTPAGTRRFMDASLKLQTLEGMRAHRKNPSRQRVSPKHEEKFEKRIEELAARGKATVRKPGLT